MRDRLSRGLRAVIGLSGSAAPQRPLFASAKSGARFLKSPIRRVSEFLLLIAPFVGGLFSCFCLFLVILSPLCFGFGKQFRRRLAVGSLLPLSGRRLFLAGPFAGSTLYWSLKQRFCRYHCHQNLSWLPSLYVRTDIGSNAWMACSFWRAHGWLVHFGLHIDI